MAAPAKVPPPPLGLVAGAGPLPAMVAETVAAGGRVVAIAAVQGLADPALAGRPRHLGFSFGEVAPILRHFAEHGVREVVLVGQFHRPAWRDLKIDLGTLRALPLLFGYARGPDGGVISLVSRLFDGAGLKVVSVADVAPSLVAGEGRLGLRAAGAGDEADIARALRLLAATGAFDVGQAAVLHAGRVIAIEAAEGTDALLARVVELRQAGRFRAPRPAGVLVKGPKPGQALRDDMPVIGAATIAGAAAAGLSGIAVVAGGTLLAEGAATVAAADEAGLFLVGVRP
jgi:UDP-2,3-diacylglucosamine hydrolase